MSYRSRVRKTIGILSIGLCVASGCGTASVDTGPVEEPNIGPGGPPGGGKVQFKKVPPPSKSAKKAGAPRAEPPKPAPEK